MEDMDFLDHTNQIRHRPNNASFNQILYADDTVLISSSAAALTRYLKELQTVARTYGLNINLDKTKHIQFNSNRRIFDHNNTPIQTTFFIEYLGVVVEKSHDISTELSHRLQKATAAWKSLDIL